MSSKQYKQVMWAEVKADVYSGDNFDKVTKHFEMFCDGDMGSDISEADIVIKVADLPPGAKISVFYPCCPECGIARDDEFERTGGGSLRIVGHAEKCECGFNWEDWVQAQYS